MKKIVVLVLLLNSCSISEPTISLLDSYELPEGITTLSEAWQYVDKLPYVAETGGKNVWQKPSTTMVRGGDCEDLAVLLALCAEKLGYTSFVVIEFGLSANHAICYIYINRQYRYLEPQQYGKYYTKEELEIVDIYSIENALEMCTE